MRSKSNSKKDTYRPQFCDAEFYLSHVAQFEIIQQKIKSLPVKAQVTLWIISCLCLRRPNSWYSGRQNLAESNFQSNIHFSMNDFFQDLGLTWPKKLNPDIGIEEFVRTVRLNPLPAAAANALYFFYIEQYPIEILCYEPKPLELLKLQIDGKRVLTFDPDFTKWPHLKYGQRDPLSFWIHDLIHAEHFFSDPQNQAGQIGFYRLLHDIITSQILDVTLLNTEFFKSFSYLMSDMNAHPLHLIKTLRAYLKLHAGEASESLWDSILSLPSICQYPEIQSAFKRVNLPIFRLDDAMTLTNFLNRSFDLDLTENHFLNTPQL